MSDRAEWLFADRALTLMNLSTATCVVYDHLTTFADEVDLVWKRPKWGVVHYLFLINRYVGDAFQIALAFVLVRHTVKDTTESCNISNILVGFATAIVLGTMQGIMSYRVSTMYSHSRKIVILLITAFAFEISSLVIIQVLTFWAHVPVPEPPGMRLCTEDSFPRWMYTVWIPVIMFELLVLLLSLSVAVKYYQEIKFIRANSPESRNSLQYILLRDSITFPFICASICIINLFTWSRFQYLVTQYTFTLAAFAPIIIGPRLILNLREAYYQPFVEELGPENPLRFRQGMTRSF